MKEALVLASKAASWPDVIAEACISDDPDYTTGYIASKEFGYLRIPNIKREKKMHGGRVFFIREAADIAGLIVYLEKNLLSLYRKTADGNKKTSQIQMKQTIFLIGNPAAGRNALRKINEATAIIKNRGHNVEMLLTGKRGDAESFAREISRQSAVESHPTVPLSKGD